MIQIRKLKHDDDLTLLLEEWVEESNDDVFGIDCNPCHTERHLKAGDQTVFVMIKDEKPVGLIGVQLLNNPIGMGIMANEHLWYVSKVCRGIGSVRFLKHAMAWAKEKGCSHFMATASMLASDLHDSVCDLYESIGMKKFETTYISRLGG